MVIITTIIITCYVCYDIGWTTDDSPDEKQLKELGDEMAAEIQKV